MNVFLKVKVKGQEEVDQKIRALNTALDTRQILDEGAAVLFNRMRTRFLQEIDPLGEPWPKSKAAMRRARIGRGGGTLFDTGKLWHSLQLYADSATSRSIGTDAKSRMGYPYPLVHQYGWGGQLRRQFLGFGDEDVQMMSQVIIRRIAQGLK